MSLRFARSCMRWLRLPALALLLLAVLVNPVLAAVGDLHEATRGTASHLHDAEQHALTQDSEDHDDAGDLLHALMHAAHCCGHLSAIPSSFTLLPMQLRHQTLVAAPSLAPPSHIQALSLRPPIAA